jgi:hypothetical protein
VQAGEAAAGGDDQVPVLRPEDLLRRVRQEQAMHPIHLTVLCPVHYSFLFPSFSPLEEGKLQVLPGNLAILQVPGTVRGRGEGGMPVLPWSLHLHAV